MKEIFLNENDEYKFLLLMEGYIVTLYYDEELINPGALLLLKIKLSSGNGEVSEFLAACVSHNGGRLVLV